MLNLGHEQIDKYGWRAGGGGANVLHISQAAGWGLETILTMALVFTVFAATDAERAVDTAHLPVRCSLPGTSVLLCSAFTQAGQPSLLGKHMPLGKWGIGCPQPAGDNT